MPWMTSNCTTVKIRKTLVILKTFRNNYVRSSSDCSLQSVPPWPPSCVFTFIRPVPTPARVHFFCTCTLPSLHLRSFLLSFLLSLPKADCPPFLLYLSFLASSSFSYLSPWFIRGSVQFTHIPLLTPLSPPPPPPPPATGLSYLCTVIYLCDPRMGRRRGRVGEMRQ